MWGGHVKGQIGLICEPIHLMRKKDILFWCSIYTSNGMKSMEKHYTWVFCGIKVNQLVVVIEKENEAFDEMWGILDKETSCHKSHKCTWKSSCASDQYVCLEML